MQNLTICEFSYKQIQTIVCVCVSVLIGGYPLYLLFIYSIYPLYIWEIVFTYL